MDLVYSLKLCITIVFDFTLDDCNTKEKLGALTIFQFPIIHSVSPQILNNLLS